MDLGAIRENMRLIAGSCGSDVAIMPVVKANGYGHGAVGIAPALMEEGAAYLAVATLTEALELKDHYPDYPVFILGHTPERLCSMVVENDITQGSRKSQTGKSSWRGGCKSREKSKGTS